MNSKVLKKKYVGYLTKSGKYISTGLFFNINNWIYKFMMGMICILLVITVIGMLALPCTLSAWSAMRLNEKWEENEENESNS